MEEKKPKIRWKLADQSAIQQSLFPNEQDQILEKQIGKGAFAGFEFYHVIAKKIINPVPEKSKMRFRYTINPYRGCSHSCTYCFARPTHEWLGLNIGQDFDTKIVVKINAAQRLRVELSHYGWDRSRIAMGTNTDPYQRAEGKYKLTKAIIRELILARNPFSILTKSTLILRDLQELKEAASKKLVRVNLSIGTLDETIWKLSEPGTPHPQLRLNALEKLNKEGIPTGVLIAPILPGISDNKDQLKVLVQKCIEAKAVNISPVLLHLRPGVKQHYMEWLEQARPDLVSHYRHWYKKSSYLPSKSQQDLTKEVKNLILEYKQGKRI